MNEIVQQIKTFGSDLKVLYIEDNKGLREGVSELLGKLFTKTVCADNGEHGYQLYLEHLPDIILTDINMPGMSGFDLAKVIKKENKDIRIIFLSAFDEKEYLYEAIEIGAFRYLSKPTKVPLLVSTLHHAVLSIHNERNERIFEKQLTDIFNYQNNLLMMLRGGEPMLVNRQFLDFFGADNLDGFMEYHGGIRELLLEHKGFLYGSAEVGWYETAFDNPGKLFHTKVRNYAGEARHLIMKLRIIPDKEGFVILSFDDITDLNLMMLFDSNATKNDQRFQDCSAVMNLMKVIKENASEVKLHNFYRGLTIINSGVLMKIDNNKIVIKTAYSQLKAIKLSNNLTITSELFPYGVWCKSAGLINFDEQSVTFSEMQFVQESANQRANIRLEPEEKRHSVTLFLNNIKFFGKTRIVDISISSVKVEMDALPGGFSTGETVRISIVLETGKQPINLLFDATVYRVDRLERNFNVVFRFELFALDEEKLRGYLANRQIELIREFKAL
ncbi:MAG: response regulator [Sulfuricurvum sp.]|jgi:CheY-like chemotaxis protein|uniref:response regulator n=1 Tax=Sulfuricurvum sp. TaxID=2025608 RepID=UPI0025EB9B0C|nr:response regulator [Sulfuricurvum sp.]MCK9374345.1 response regulator [Sulfuricurvum sp.]